MKIHKFLLQALLLLNLLCAVDRQALADTLAQPIPFKHEPASAGDGLLRGMGGLALCIVVLGGVLYAMRHRMAARITAHLASSTATRRLRVVETQRLGSRSALYVVEFAGMDYLVAQGEHGITLLASVPGPPAGNREAAR